MFGNLTPNSVKELAGQFILASYAAIVGEIKEINIIFPVIGTKANTVAHMCAKIVVRASRWSWWLSSAPDFQYTTPATKVYF